METFPPQAEAAHCPVISTRVVYAKPTIHRHIASGMGRLNGGAASIEKVALMRAAYNDLPILLQIEQYGCH